MSIRVLIMVATLCLSLVSSRVYADDSETALLRQQITLLQQQLQQLSQRLEAIEAQPTKGPVVTTSDVSTEELASEEKSSRLDVASDGAALKFASADGNYKFQVGGRVQADAAVFDSDIASFGNGSEIRRARLFVSGTLFGDWQFKNQIDFAGNGTSINDSYLRYVGFKNTSITVGNFKEPFSQEELQSSNHLPFIERAQVIDEFAPDRALGLAVDFNGVYGAAADRSWTASFGVYGDGLDDADFNTQTGEEIDESIAFTGRLSTALVKSKDRLAHFAAAYTNRNVDGGNTLAFDSTIESDIADANLVDTGTISGVDSFSIVGLEAVGAYGPFSLQGEYLRTNVERDASPDLEFDGFYIYGSWFLTGESRAAAYKSSTGVVRGISPLSPLSDGGRGAWEFAARYGKIDLTSQEIIGGVQEDITLALNWYPNKNLRFSFNYVDVLSVSGGASNNDEPSAYLVRGQVTF